MDKTSTKSTSTNPKIYPISITKNILVIIVIYIISCVLVIRIENYYGNTPGTSNTSPLISNVASNILLRHVVVGQVPNRQLVVETSNVNQWWLWSLCYWLLRLGRQTVKSPYNSVINTQSTTTTLSSSPKYTSSNSVTPFPGKKGAGFVLSSSSTSSNNGYASYDNNLPKVLA